MPLQQHPRRQDISSNKMQKLCHGERAFELASPIIFRALLCILNNNLQERTEKGKKKKPFEFAPIKDDKVPLNSQDNSSESRVKPNTLISKKSHRRIFLFEKRNAFLRFVAALLKYSIEILPDYFGLRIHQFVQRNMTHTVQSILVNEFVVAECVHKSKNKVRSAGENY